MPLEIDYYVSSTQALADLINAFESNEISDILKEAMLKEVSFGLTSNQYQLLSNILHNILSTKKFQKGNLNEMV